MLFSHPHTNSALPLTPCRSGRGVPSSPQDGARDGGPSIQVSCKFGSLSSTQDPVGIGWETSTQDPLKAGRTVITVSPTAALSSATLLAYVVCSGVLFSGIPIMHVVRSTAL